MKFKVVVTWDHGFNITDTFFADTLENLFNQINDKHPQCRVLSVIGGDHDGYIKNFNGELTINRNN